MKHYFKSGTLFTAAIFMLFIFLAIFSAVFFMIHIQGGLFVLKDSIKIITVYLTLFYNESDITSFPDTIKNIDSNFKLEELGIFKQDGENIFMYGNIPEKVLDEEIFDLNENSGYVSVTYPFITDNNEKRILFLKLYLGNNLKKYKNIKLLSIIAPVFFIVLMIIFIILFRRNVKYQNKMASQEQLVRLGEISRTLSHEIKNPLSAIRIQTGYLKRTLPEGKHGDLNIIEQEVQRLTNLTIRIGDILKNPEGRIEKLDLSEHVLRIIRNFSCKIDFKNEINGHVFIDADPECIRSVFENIIQNAIDSMPDNVKKDTTVKIVLKPLKQNKIQVSVFDKGCGISDEHKSRIFDPFFTTKSKGSGIGLFIARRLVEVVGGSLHFYANEDCGTEARIIFLTNRGK